MIAALSTTSVEILKFLTANLTRDFTILQIAKSTGKTTRLTYAAVKRLVEDKVIIIEEKANLKLCRLNLRLPQIIAFIESIRWRDFARRHPEISLLVSDITQRCDLPYLTLLVFGSYARGKVTKASDLDLLVITPDRKFDGSVEVAVKAAISLSRTALHHIIISYPEFLHMLTERKTNVVREALEARYVAYGAEPLYAMVGRTM